MQFVLKLADLLEDNDKVSATPIEAVPELRAALARLDSLLLMRLMIPQFKGPLEHQAEDRLLTVEEAAVKLGKSKDSLYRNASKYPFTVRDGRNLRFSQQGIDRFIRQRMGR